ncbi:PST family polysaccharide transporter [Rhodococcus sp. PvP016]|uniref:PST family polysaccharide transporter n=2 Tax=Mycobacteriales TaxID=85007 RepID=A0ABS2KZ90_9NOCA|nr:PST family polysaccharide transporter [Rhodococcus corynebacterioides]MBP1115496.1 PST family polysaccharide transporter [Rhodococcus sp. PvP016]
MTTRGSQAALLLFAATQMAPEDYGQFAIASAIVILASLIAEGGVVQATTTATNVSLRDEQALAGRAVIVGLLVAIAAVVGAFWFSFKDGFEQTVYFTTVLASLIPLTACAAVSAGRLQRRNMFRQLAVYQIQGSALAAILCVTLIATGYPMVGLVVLSSTTTLVYSLRILLTKETRIVPRFEKSDRHLSHLSNYALLSNLIGVFGRRSGEFAAGIFAGPAAVGQFSIAYRVLTTGTEVLLHSRERVFLADAARRGNNLSKENSWKTSNKDQVRNLVLVGPVFLAAGAACYLGLPYLFGPDWNAVGTLAMILCLSGVAQSGFNLTYSSLYVIENPRSALYFQALQVVVLTAALVVGMISSIMVGAIAYAVASFVFAIFTVPFRIAAASVNRRAGMMV